MKAEELREIVDSKLPWSASHGVIRDRDGNDVAAVADRNSIGDGEATAHAIVALANHATALVELVAACEELRDADIAYYASKDRMQQATNMVEYSDACDINGAAFTRMRTARDSWNAALAAVHAIGVAPGAASEHGEPEGERG